MNSIDAIVPWHVNCALTSAYAFYRGKRRWGGEFSYWCQYFKENEFSSYEDYKIW